MNPVEETFVNTFIQKNRRERAQFELASEAKRGSFLNRLCHSYSGVFDARYLQPINEPTDYSGLQKMLEKLGAKRECHVISCNDTVDGKQMLLQDAITATMGFGLPSIIICVGDRLAYFEAEQESGPPPRYFLIKQQGGT